VVPVDELLNERGLADPAAPPDDQAFSRLRPADLAGAWAALERIAKAADPGEPPDPAEPGR